MQFIAACHTNGELSDIDFSMVTVPSDLRPLRQTQDKAGNFVDEVSITIHRPTLNEAPNTDEYYGFCGFVHVTVENHHGKNFSGRECATYDGLRFVSERDIEGNPYDIYRLPRSHPGHDEFRGCSGAPMISGSGQLVGLLCRGNEETDELHALPLRRYKSTIDAYLHCLTE
jgi:hypothetical protein